MDSSVEAQGVRFREYDIFGYLFPGFACLSIIYLFEYKINPTPDGQTIIYTPVANFITESLQSVSSNNIAAQFLLVFMLFCLCYALGHIIASVSSLLIDKILVYKGHGYPFNRILDDCQIDDKNDQTFPASSVSQQYHKGSWALFNIIFVLFIITYWMKWIAWFNCSAVIILSIFVLMTIIKVLRQWRYLKKKKCVNSLIEYLEKLFLVPSVFYDLPRKLINNFFNYDKTFDEDFRREFQKKYYSTFKLKANTFDTNNYWMPYFHVANTSPVLYKLAVTWLKLYGFARNLSIAMLLAFLYCSSSLYRNYEDLTPTKTSVTYNYPAKDATLKLINSIPDKKTTLSNTTNLFQKTTTTVNINLSFFTPPLFQYLQSNLFEVDTREKVYRSAMIIITLSYLGFILLLIHYYYLYCNYYTRFIFRSFVYITNQSQPTPTSLTQT